MSDFRIGMAFFMKGNHMEIAVLLLFCAMLLAVILCDGSLVAALAAGWVLFIFYGLKKRFRFGKLVALSTDGIFAAENILITFMLIGILTAVWRLAGTIPAIVFYASKWIRPELILVLTFLLNGAVSFLFGSSFATAATMGVICMTMGLGLGADPAIMGGAILSGIYFGDRCSPVSTSALLVSEITHTNLYDNIRNMFRTAAVPFALACVFYFGIGFLGNESGEIQISQLSVFSECFDLSIPVLLPAAAILLLGAFRVPVKRTLSVGILFAAACALLFQHVSVSDILYAAVFGFSSEREDLQMLLGGGGVVSMLRVAAIVCISSSYIGIFHGTGMLDDLKEKLLKLSGRLGRFGVMILMSFLNSAIACNQTLAIMLTNELCGDFYVEETKRAIALENSVVMIAALVPWSIACAVPLESVGAPSSSVAAAAYLWLLPLWHWFRYK